MGDDEAPDAAEMLRLSGQLGGLLMEHLPKQWDFVLVLSVTNDEGGLMSYSSSMGREGALLLLRELIEKTAHERPECEQN